MKRFRFSIESYKPKYRRTKMTGPNPNAIYPNEAIKSVVFIKNDDTRPNILVGDTPTIDDVNGASGLRPCTHHYPFFGDKLIIGKFAPCKRD